MTLCSRLEEAQAVVKAIQASTRQMKSEAAWAVASRRAGHFFGLPRTAGTHDSDGGELDTESDGPPADDGAGFEGLRTFTTQVQVVGAAQQEEFFASDKPSERSMLHPQLRQAPAVMSLRAWERKTAAMARMISPPICQRFRGQVSSRSTRQGSKPA